MRPTRSTSMIMNLRAFVCAFVLITTAISSFALSPNMSFQTPLVLPYQIAGWSGTDQPITDVVKKIYAESSNQLITRVYKKTGCSELEMNIAQAGLNNNPHEFFRCLECAGAKFTENKIIRTADGNAVTSLRYFLDGKQYESLVWYQFGRQTVALSGQLNLAKVKCAHLFSHDCNVAQSVCITQSLSALPADAATSSLSDFASAVKDEIALQTSK